MHAPSEAETAPAVLLLHGQPGWGELWQGVRARLEPRFTVLSPDRPGWGRNRRPAGDFDLNVDAACGQLDTAGVERAVVAAHSWAAGVAVRLAERHPDRVAALVLVAPAVTRSAYGPADRVLGTAVGAPLVRGGFALASRALGTRPFGRMVARAGAGALDSPRIARGLADPRAWRSFLVEERAALREVGELERGLRDISRPAIVLQAEHDKVVPARAVGEVADALPCAERVVVAGSGHLLPVQRPDAVASAIERALAAAG